MRPRDEHYYLVSYDIRDDRRWRRRYRTLRGYGQWLQLSVFQCRLSRRRMVELEAAIREIVHNREDHVLIVDLGHAGNDLPAVRSIGPPYEPPVRGPVIV